MKKKLWFIGILLMSIFISSSKLSEIQSEQALLAIKKAACYHASGFFVGSAMQLNGASPRCRYRPSPAR